MGDDGGALPDGYIDSALGAYFGDPGQTICARISGYGHCVGISTGRHASLSGREGEDCLFEILIFVDAEITSEPGDWRR